MVLAGLAATAAPAATRYVPANYPTIQGAINAAANGDTIIVSKGRYRENLDFAGKAVTVRSTKPTNATVVSGTVIDGGHNGSVVFFHSGETRAAALKGFTIINGSGTLSNGNYHGGGISCWNGASPTITDNVIRNNAVGWSGGGVYCYASSPLLARNTITANTSLVRGGGVSCEGSSAAVISNNTINGNSAADSSSGVSSFGGGIYCELSSDVTITANRILENCAGTEFGAGFGGGVDCYACNPLLSANVIRGNRALGNFIGVGGGVCAGYAGDVCAPSLTGNTISANTAATSGGGVYCNGNSAMTNNVIGANTAGASGGGVYVSLMAVPALVNDTISGNSATDGGGVYCASLSQPILRNTIIAFSSGGGGLSAVVDLVQPAEPTVTYCDLYENTGGNYVNCPNRTGVSGNFSRNPLFANAAGGDFHLKSKGGRWSVAAGAWVIDAAHSPCIDAGAPRNAYRDEPAPNGGRINMGAYGNTRWASKAAPATAPGTALVTASATSLNGGAAAIAISLSCPATVEVTVLNAAGRQVASLPAQELAAGLSTLTWNGRGAQGTRVPPGQYLVRVRARGEAGGQSEALTRLTTAR